VQTLQLKVVNCSSLSSLIIEAESPNRAVIAC
jgi:hypothetical protein